jgi:hypothetical protein
VQAAFEALSQLDEDEVCHSLHSTGRYSAVLRSHLLVSSAVLSAASLSVVQAAPSAKRQLP